MYEINFNYFKSIEILKNILLQLQQRYGQLNLLFSRTVQGSSRSIDKILKTIIYFLKNQLRMYDINIFDDFKTKPTYLPIFATCYNYLLVNTNFSSQHLLKQDMILGDIVGTWPTLSPYLFIQIIWHSKCEDLLIESLMHIPLDLCIEILEITIKHIDDLPIQRAKRLIFLLIYKLYNKCLWLHLSILSEQNFTKLIQQLLMYFEMLLNLITNPKFVTSPNLSIGQKYLQHGILVKNILQCVKKCMHSKIKTHLENYNLTRFFRLTYGNLNEHINYQIFPVSNIKSIIIRLDHKLATLLLNQIKHIGSSEYIVWKNIADEDTIISIHRAIIIECHYLREFMKQNNFLMKNEQMLCCLKHLIGPRKSEEYILTVQELCHHIANGYLHGIKELINRYKEWDLSTLDFIKKRIKLLSFNDLYIVLEYLYYKFTYLHTKTEKYQVYVSVLKILIQLKEQEMHFIILKYMKQHFDDNCLEFLYDEKSFDTFIKQNLLDEKFNDSQSMMNAMAQRCRVLLIFILLNPKEVLSKLIFYEISIEDTESDSILFQHNMFACIIRNYFSLMKDQTYNLLMYILKNIILDYPQDTGCKNFKTFMTKVLDYQMIAVDDVINELYIPYLRCNYFEGHTIDAILSHIQSIVDKKLYTHKTELVFLITVLVQKASVLRKLATFSKFLLSRWMGLINDIICLCFSNRLTKEQRNMLYIYSLDYVEPLDIKKLRYMNGLEIIREYEKRYFVIHRQLRTDPQSHPKLRSYVKSFYLDREAFIRYVMLHCFEMEYVMIASDLTFTFWYHFGWTDQIMAYENIMRITVDVSHIVLMYLDVFPKNTFVMLLFAIVQFCRFVAKKWTHDKYDAIKSTLFNTLHSMSHMVNKTYYGKMYNILLENIQNVDSYMNRQDYFEEVHEWVNNFFKEYEFLEPEIFENCICDESSNCKHYNLVVENEITKMYNIYTFIRECTNTFKANSIHRYSDYLLRKFDLAEEF